MLLLDLRRQADEKWTEMNKLVFQLRISRLFFLCVEDQYYYFSFQTVSKMSLISSMNRGVDNTCVQKYSSSPTMLGDLGNIATSLSRV